MSKLDKIFILIAFNLSIIFGVFLIGYKSDQQKQLRVQKISDGRNIINSDKILNYEIEVMSQNNNLYNISGWALVKGIESKDVDPAIILADDKNNYYKVKTKIVKRADIKEEINDGLSYMNSGITSEFYLDGLDKNNEYKIGINMKIGQNEYFTWTDKKIVFK
ncbi:hypothetical protein [Clostridium intestinale]|uniref:hypothetical protein n=1 Tax=Clostridium intestinale TaxID=36845 RepID=UPI0028EE35AD|nr:hypothetical protein [Clostridium intestinale]